VEGKPSAVSRLILDTDGTRLATLATLSPKGGEGIVKTSARQDTRGTPARQLVRFRYSCELANEIWEP
jgi:hypothetical protein